MSLTQPVWITKPGSLGTVHEGEFFQLSLKAYDPITGTNDDLYFRLLAGELPDGVQVGVTGLIAGIPRAVASSQGVPAEVGENITSEFSVRVYTLDELGQINEVHDRTFDITVTGQDIPEFDTPPGEIGRYYDGDYVNLQIDFSDEDPGDEVFAYVASGNLPDGLSMDENGLITGFVDPVSELDLEGIGIPGFDSENVNWDMYPLDFGTRSISKNYEFSVKITDGKEYRLRNFSIYIYSRDSMTADNEEQTADDSFVTADTVNKRSPYIDNYEYDIGRYRHDNFFVYNFEGVDPDGSPIAYQLASGTLPPGLNLDMETGYIYGYLDDIGVQELEYNFSLTVYKIEAENDNTGFVDFSLGFDSTVWDYDSRPEGSYDPESEGQGEGLWDYVTPAVGNTYDYTISIYGFIDTGVEWLTDDVQLAADEQGSIIDLSWVESELLGVIDNGEISYFYIEAEHNEGVVLQYRLLSGSNSKLPQGLALLPSGNISGRVNFQTFALDNGATTFDKLAETRLQEGAETTFDMLYEFTVEAFNDDDLVRVTKRYSILVNRKYNSPAQTLRIEAYSPLEDRDLIETLVRNNDIIRREWIYRPDDPWFGINTKVHYEHAYGLNPSQMVDYVESVTKNHYRKNITLGDIRTARALDDYGNVIYELVYAHINDDQTNQQNESTSASITQEFSNNNGTVGTELTVYPNSFDNMRNEVVDTVGQIAPILPRWMLSKQEDGSVLGFTRAWVIAYVNPGNSKQLKYTIDTKFNNKLNLVDFEVDRYVLDNYAIQGWDTVNAEWQQLPDVTFDEDETTFDIDETSFVTLSKMTTFDRQFGGPETETIFDGGATKFIINSVQREFTDKYDKYIVFPQRRIIDND